MKDFLISKLAPLVIAVCAVAAAAALLHNGPDAPVVVRTPGRDNPTGGPEAKVDIARDGKLTAFDGTPAPELTGSWSQFRGPALDGVSGETGLAKTFPTGGPKVLWQVDCGEGYAGPAVLNGRVYLLDYDPPDTWLVRPADIADVPALCRALTAAKAAPPIARIAELVGPDVLAAARKIAAGASGPTSATGPAATTRPADPAELAALIAGLNALLPREDFFRHEDFAAVRLGGETNRLLARPQGRPDGPLTLRPDLPTSDVLRLNRILLEAALPQLARSQHGDVMRCLSLADGRDIWRFSYPVRVKRNHGMSRTVPAVTDKVVVSLGPKCHVVCLDSQTGEYRWDIDLVAKYGTVIPAWYAGQCPLIDGDRVILAPGGTKLLIAVDLASKGEPKILWETENPDAWQMSHSTPVPMTFQGRRMYVYAAAGGVAGVDAETGKLLWRTGKMSTANGPRDQWKISIATVPTPIVFDDGRIFLTGGYDAGCAMMQLTMQGDQIVPTILLPLEPGQDQGAKDPANPELWRLSAAVFGATQQTPILYKGHIYGMRPDGQFACLGLDGKLLWTSGSAHRFGQGLGPYLAADGLLYIMDDAANLTLIEANPQKYTQLAAAKILPKGHDSWGPFALASGRLIVRDMTRMVCLDVGK